MTAGHQQRQWHIQRIWCATRSVEQSGGAFGRTESAIDKLFLPNNPANIIGTFFCENRHILHLRVTLVL